MHEKDQKYKLLIKEITEKKCNDTALAIILILLLLTYFLNNQILYLFAIPVIILDMICPLIFKPFAFVWFGLAEVMSTFMSKILLTIIFFVIITPVGLIRRSFKKDSLQLKKWKKNSSSVFYIRNHKFQSKDIENPY